MKNILKYLLTLAMGIVIGAGMVQQHPPKIQKEIYEVPVAENKPLDKWQTFILALSEVESEHDPKAKGGDGHGIFQITPIYIAEVNNIQDCKTYHSKDRMDIDKSLEMIKIFNDIHNRQQDIDRAIKLHNPTASPIYRKKILKKMAEIKKREKIRFHILKQDSL